MLTKSGVGPELPAVPEGVEVYRRAGQGKNVFIFENLDTDAQTVRLPHAMKNVLSGGTAESLTLQQYGVAVMEEDTVGASGKPAAR
jgi:beta-galactosidase GanA